MESRVVLRALSVLLLLYLPLKSWMRSELPGFSSLASKIQAGMVLPDL